MTAHSLRARIFEPLPLSDLWNLYHLLHRVVTNNFGYAL